MTHSSHYFYDYMDHWATAETHCCYFLAYFFQQWIFNIHWVVYIIAFIAHVLEHWLEREIAQWVQNEKYGARVGPRRNWCDGSSDRSLIVDPLSYLSFQPVLYDWCNKRPWCVLSCLWDGAYKRTLAANRE